MKSRARVTLTRDFDHQRLCAAHHREDNIMPNQTRTEYMSARIAARLSAAAGPPQDHAEAHMRARAGAAITVMVEIATAPNTSPKVRQAASTALSDYRFKKPLVS